MYYQHFDEKEDIFPPILEYMSREKQVDIYKDRGLNSYYYFVVNIRDACLCKVMRQDILSTSDMFDGKYTDNCEPMRLRYQFRCLQ